MRRALYARSILLSAGLHMSLGVLLAGYGFTLVQMRRMSTGRPFPRLLTDPGEG